MIKNGFFHFISFWADAFDAVYDEKIPSEGGIDFP